MTSGPPQLDRAVRRAPSSVRTAAPQSLVPRPVPAQLLHVVEAVAEAGQQPPVEPASGRHQRVVLPETLLADANEARPPKVGEMPGHRRLRRPQHRHEISYAHLAVVLEQVEDPEARTIRKRPEHEIDVLSAHGFIVFGQNGVATKDTSTVSPLAPRTAASSTM